MQISKPLKKSHLKKLSNDPEATAKAVKLVYINSTNGGITREREGKNFIYKTGNKLIRNKEELQRIHSVETRVKKIWQQKKKCLCVF